MSTNTGLERLGKVLDREIKACKDFEADSSRGENEPTEKKGKDSAAAANQAEGAAAAAAVAAAAGVTRGNIERLLTMAERLCEFVASENDVDPDLD